MGVRSRGREGAQWGSGECCQQMGGPLIAVTVPTHGGRVCSHTDASVHTALRPGGRGGFPTAGPTVPGEPHLRRGPDTTCASAPARGAAPGAQASLSSQASHLQGNPTASHRRGQLNSAHIHHA